MRASKEVRRWVNRMRSRYGGKNGVVPGYVFDYPSMERKAATSWKRLTPVYDAQDTQKGIKAGRQGRMN